jgi:tetratricopeptide (TPR) repeat protein
VEGRALSDVILDARTLREKLALLPNLIAVTEALAYAHDNEIVHRDLKPSNVLIGAFGETVVIDWGIAKDRAERNDSTEAAAIVSDAEVFETKAGSAMGTVGYMSPEQARTAAVDERADVYSLGAVLYHLFAGTPPHPSVSVKEALEKLMSGPPEPLAQLVPDLAPDLIAIIEKAMARDADARYPDARAMAEDLKRFEAGKLVAAHSYSLGTLLRRWMVRYRAVVITAAVLLIALVVTVTVSVRRIVHERDKADAARAETEKARANAVAQRDAAEKLVEFMVRDLKLKLETVGRLDLITGVGEEVDRYYQTASAFTPDAATLVSRAQALQLIAIVEDYKLDEKGAGPLFDHAIALCERALVLSPNDSTAQITLVNIHVNVAGSLIDLGRFDLAEQHARKAIEVGRQAVAGHPGEPRSATVLSRGELRLALVLRQAGRAAETPPLYADACALLEGAMAGEPKNLEIAREAGWAYFERGDADLDRGDLDDATISLARSIQLRERLSADDPTPERANNLAWSRLRAAETRLRKGDFDAAMNDGAAAVARLEEVTPKDPAEVMGRRNLAMALSALAGDEVDVGRCASAAARERRSVDIMDAIAKGEATSESKATLIDGLGVLGEAELCAGRPHEARLALERAASIYATIADSKQESAVETMDSTGPYLTLAQLADGDPAAALATARAAVTRAEERVAGAPNDYASLETSGLSEMALGDVLASRHDPAAATAYRAAHEAFVKRTRAFKNPLLDPVTTAEAAIKLARLAPKDEARALIDEAVSSLDALDKAHRLVPRGTSALRDARALAASSR